MNKQQRLKNLAEGLLGGLVAIGFEGPWPWAHHQWERAFYKVWRTWPPAEREPQYFRAFALGGAADGRTSQARDILFAINRNSPFDGYNRIPLTHRPLGMLPETYVIGATPQEWMDLARALLAEIGHGTDSSANRP